MKSDLSVTVKRYVPAPPDRAFRYWTDAQHLQRWWGPEGVTCPEASIDLRVGGTYRIGNSMPNGSIIWIHGVFESVDPPNQIVFSWAVGLDSEPSERVIVRFDPSGVGTEVVVIHALIVNEAVLKEHEAGWIGCLAGLASYSESA